MQTGAQLTAGFLLTLPFQQRFADLTDAAARRLPGPGRPRRRDHRAGADAGGDPPAAVRGAREGPAGRGVGARDHARRCSPAWRCSSPASSRSSSTSSSTAPARSSSAAALAVLLVVLLARRPARAGRRLSARLGRPKTIGRKPLRSVTSTECAILPLEHPGTADHRSPGRFLWWMAKGQWHTLLGGMFFGIVWMSSQAVMPVVIGRAIDRGVADQDGRALVTYAAVMLGIGARAGGQRHHAAPVRGDELADRGVPHRPARRPPGRAPRRHAAPQGLDR